MKNDNAGKVAARAVDELRDSVKKAFARLLATPEAIRGFFRSPDLTYINIPIT